jgi:DNA damage-binding protein 1
VDSLVPITRERNHFLLGDSLGNLHVLQLVQRGSDERILRLEKIGETSIPSALVYMDDQRVFLGSHYGDSQLIGLNNAPSLPSLKVLSTYTNLAPVVDFCVMDLEKQNQSQLVTCSGGFKEGSLNIIHSGIGVKELADLQVVGLKKIWSLEGLSSEYHQTLVLAFVDETRVMTSKEDGSIEELEDDDFIRHEATLFCSNVAEHFILQATATRILLLDHSHDMLADWMPSTGETITHVSAHNRYILLSLSGGTIVSLEIVDGQIHMVTQKQSPSEVSCLDIAPYDSIDPLGNLCIVGFWKHMFHVYQMPNLTLIVQDVLDGGKYKYYL